MWGGGRGGTGASPPGRGVGRRERKLVMQNLRHLLPFAVYTSQRVQTFTLTGSLSRTFPGIPAQGQATFPWLAPAVGPRQWPCPQLVPPSPAFPGLVPLSAAQPAFWQLWLSLQCPCQGVGGRWGGGGESRLSAKFFPRDHPPHPKSSVLSERHLSVIICLISLFPVDLQLHAPRSCVVCLTAVSRAYKS